MFMGSRNEFIGLFHNCASEFLTAMEEAFPSNKKLIKYNRKYQMSREANVHQAIQYFKHYMSDYKQAIIDKDINVFLNIELDDDADEENILDALQIKKMWSKSSENDKKENGETIFKYLKLLLFFADKVYE